MGLAAAVRMDTASSGLKKTLGLTGLTFSAVGLILGAGIYSVLGAAAGEAGDGLWWSFLFASLVASLTGFSYAELATMFPKAGAEYVYLREALPKARWAAALTGYLLVVSGASTATTVALAFQGYLQRFVSLPAAVVSVGLLALATAVNIVGVKGASGANIVFTLIEASGLVLVIVLGVQEPKFAEALTALPSMGVVSATALVFFAYLGFEGIANLAEEAEDAPKQVPRAIVLSLVVSTVLYVMVALAALALAEPETLASSRAPLASAVAARSPRLAGALGGVALFATANTALMQLLIASRTLFGMARGGDAPKVFAKVLPSRKTPWVASLALLGASLAILPLGRVDAVASLASMTSLLAFASVHLAVIVLRKRAGERERPFRVPLAVGWVPVLPCVGLATTLGLATRFEPVVYAITGGCAVAALGLYALQRRGHRGGADRPSGER